MCKNRKVTLNKAELGKLTISARSIIWTGRAGMLPNGKIVDMLIYPEAVPLTESK